MRIGPVLLFLSMAATAQSVAAQGIDGLLHGFVQVNWSVRATGADRPELLTKDFLLGEERLQLELEDFSANGTAGFRAKVDFFHDALANRARFEIREAYVDAEIDLVALRFGRQIVTWGVGDLVFINDLFPKDYTAFFSGRPLQYLKIGVDALTLNITAGLTSAEIVLTPSFQPDRLPAPDRFVFADPFSGLARVEQRPELQLANVQVAGRVYRRLVGADVSFYAYRGFHGSPAPRPDPGPGLVPTRVALVFPRLNAYGASVEGAGFGGVVSAEVGYYDSREDPTGSDPWIPNSEIRALVGYRRQVGAEGQFGLQYYAERMQDHEAYVASLSAGFEPRDEVRHVATLRYTQQLAYQTWQLSLFVFLGLSETDYLAIPEVRHRLTDELWASVGANVFGGGPQDLFGALDDNDNFYITVRYGF